MYCCLSLNLAVLVSRIFGQLILGKARILSPPCSTLAITLKCYSNFHFRLDTKFAQDRRRAMNLIPSDLVYYEPSPTDRQTAWTNQSHFSFVISPHGNGLDCHRTWEALALGCIPIVRSSPLDILYEDLPVAIVNDWSDVTPGFLLTEIEKRKEKQEQNQYNFSKLTLTYWVNQIYSKKKQCEYMSAWKRLTT